MESYEEEELFMDFFNSNPLEEYFVTINPLSNISYDSTISEMEALLKSEKKFLDRIPKDGNRISTSGK